VAFALQEIGPIQPSGADTDPHRSAVGSGGSSTSRKSRPSTFPKKVMTTARMLLNQFSIDDCVKENRLLHFCVRLDMRMHVPPEGNNIFDKPFHACILLA